MSIASVGSRSLESSYSLELKSMLLNDPIKVEDLINDVCEDTEQPTVLKREPIESFGLNNDNELVDAKPMFYVPKEPPPREYHFSNSYDDDDWMDEVDISRFASDVAATGFEMSPSPNSHQPANGRCFPKPNYSYSCLIALALKNSRTGRLTVSEIYAFMCENFPYFKSAPSGWKNSVRHNLSLNKCFMKIEVETPGVQGRKSCLWMIRPEKAAKMEADLQRWRDKDAGNIEDAIKRPEDIDAVHEGRRGVPREDRSLRTIENMVYPAMKNVLIVQSTGANSATNNNGSASDVIAHHTSHSSESHRNVSQAASVYAGPSRAVLDLNDRVGIGFPDSRTQNKQPLSSIAFPVRVSAREDRSTNQGTSPAGRFQNLPHKPNILRRSNNGTSMLVQTRSSLSRTPVKSLSDLLPANNQSRLELTPSKDELTPNKEFLCSFRAGIEESPIRSLFSSYEAVHAALTNNSLLDCALEQSPYKGDAPITFPHDLTL